MGYPAGSAFLNLLALRVYKVASRRASGTLSSKKFYFKCFSLNYIYQTLNNPSHNKYLNYVADNTVVTYVK